MPCTLKIILNQRQAEAMDWPAGTECYLKSFDIEWQGIGKAELTLNPDEAILWDSFTEALDDWRRQSDFHPFRADGHPNRPLTAYTIELEQR